jgi:hypothetical protein
MSGRRIELSGTQVVASMLAAVTGAIAASYAGIAGTVIGVAVMSVVSTAGSAVYRHYLARSQERLRSAVVVIAPHASHNGTAGHRARLAAGKSAQATGKSAQATGESARATGKSAQADGQPVRISGHAAAAGHTGDAAGRSADAELAAGRITSWPWSPDGPMTDEFPAVGSGETARWSSSSAEAFRPTDYHGLDQAEATQEMPGGPDNDGPRADVNGPGPDTGTDHESVRPAGSPSGRRRWLAIAAAAIAVFLLTLGAITAVEVIAGKPLDALIWGRSGGGTTVGRLAGVQHPRADLRTKPHPSKPTPAAHPTRTSSPTPTPSRSPSHTPSPSPSPSPSPTSSSTGVGSPSPSASAAPSKGHSSNG